MYEITQKNERYSCTRKSSEAAMQNQSGRHVGVPAIYTSRYCGQDYMQPWGLDKAASQDATMLQKGHAQACKCSWTRLGGVVAARGI
jgi:hypothetical protein